MGIGYSRPQLIRADDGRDYVVKFRSNRQGLRVLPNELVAGGCARALGLPIPALAIVHVSQELLDATVELQRFRKAPGPQFGCEFIPRAHDEPWYDVVANVVNIGDLAGIITFDTWSHNVDRSWRESNIDVTRDSQGRYRVIMFDQGWVFGGKPHWSAESLRLQRDLVNPPFMDGFVYDCFQRHIRGENPFESWLRKVEDFSPKTIWRLTQQIPAEWGISLSEKVALTDYLLHRRKLVRPLIMGLQRKFRHWQ